CGKASLSAGAFSVIQANTLPDEKPDENCISSSITIALSPLDSSPETIRRGIEQSFRQESRRLASLARVRLGLNQPGASPSPTRSAAFFGRTVAVYCNSCEWGPNQTINSLH